MPYYPPSSGGISNVVEDTTPQLGGNLDINGKNITGDAGTITTASDPILDLTQTWNDGAVTFIGGQFNITDTASAAASTLFDFKVGGTSRFRINKNGGIIFNLASPSSSNPEISFDNGVNSQKFYTAGGATWIGGAGAFGCLDNQFQLSGWGDLNLWRDAGNILTQRNGTNAQSYYLYNTYTDASNYERGFFKWNTNVLQIGPEAAGTGTQRQLEIAGGTVTADTPINITQTWNNGAVNFKGVTINITNTASSGGSPFAVYVGGGEQFKVGLTGTVEINNDCIVDGDIISRQGANKGTLKNGGTGGQLGLGASNTIDFTLTRVQAGTAAVGDGTDGGAIAFPDASELTIATAAITVSGTYHTVDTEADAASDDLETISGGTDGMIIILQAESGARTVVVKDGVGNIQCAGDFSLDNAQDTIMLIYSAALTAWVEISRSDNGA